MLSGQAGCTIDYLEWVKDRPDSVRYDFAASDLAREASGGIPDVLRELPAPPADASVESLVAARYGSGVSPANVLVTAGTSSANTFVAADAVDQAERDGTVGAPRVLTETPGYEPLSATPRALGASVDHFRRPLETDYGVAPEAVRDAVDGDVCLVSITNRHNPSGRLLAGGTLESLATTVSDADATLLVDEVYAPFVTDGLAGAGTAFGGPTAAGSPATVVTNSLTKFFGLNSLRLGWLVAEADAVDRLRSIQRHVLDVSPTSRHFGRVALHNADALADRSRRVLEENTDLLCEFVAATDGLDGPVAPGQSMAFLSYGSVDGDTVAQAALDEGIAVAPGRFFGDPSRFRLSLTRDPTRTAEGLRAFGDVLDSIE